MGSGKQRDRGHPWRDNIEAVTVSIIIIVLFKYFVLEAYKIPTGSMQPTLMGWSDPNGGGIFDRVLVDKFSYHYRDPERYEVVVFKYPLDRSKNFIKRIVGMPGETLEIRDGDLFHARPGEDMKILRRPRPVQRTQLRLLEGSPEYSWRVDEGSWTTQLAEATGTGPGRISFPSDPRGIRDHYTDGYPVKLAERVRSSGKGSGNNPVGDLRVEGVAAAAADCTEIKLVLREASRVYTLTVPGPAASAEERPSIRVQDLRGSFADAQALAATPWKLRAGDSVRIAGQNIDDLLELEIDGEVVVELEIGSVSNSNDAHVSIVTEGGGADLEDLQVHRDIYYTTARQKYRRWQIPEGQYVMLGDNTQDSSDSRDWSLTRYSIPDDAGGEQVVRGNQRSQENPLRSFGPGGDATLYFRDELGELWIFDNRESRRLESEAMSFVPRSLVRGRAVLVVWPIVPSLDVYRIQWVR